MTDMPQRTPNGSPFPPGGPPELLREYLPPEPAHYRPQIGLIGCGGISRHHLTAYRAAGWRVAAVCDLSRAAAEARRDEFAPEAEVFVDHRMLLERAEIDVVDVATHPPQRSPLIEAALRAGKHVLSQKPFVLDLREGRRLCEIADAEGRLLAVNQNARWAPHFSYAAAAVRGGWLGPIHGAHLSVHWDHSWTVGTPFENIRHLILYDYAIHWFDVLGQFALGPPRRVFASAARSREQTARPPLLGQALIEYDHAQATLAFDGHTPHGSEDRTLVAGARGVVSSVGPGNRWQTLQLRLGPHTYQPRLVGSWFSDGFRGAMGELLCAIEEARQPNNNARDNLKSLALCFAAVASAEDGCAYAPGEVTELRI